MQLPLERSDNPLTTVLIIADEVPPQGVGQLDYQYYKYTITLSDSSAYSSSNWHVISSETAIPTRPRLQVGLPTQSPQPSPLITNFEPREPRPPHFHHHSPHRHHDPPPPIAHPPQSSTTTATISTTGLTTGTMVVQPTATTKTVPPLSSATVASNTIGFRGSETNTGAIVGGVIGGIVGLGLMALVVFLVYRKHQRDREEFDSSRVPLKSEV